MPRQSLAPQIMAQILDHVRAEGMRRDQHLPAQALADQFRVSRAPVVSALRQLEKAGIVRSETNRGFFLNRDAANLPAPADTTPDEDAVYFRIAEDRLAGRLPDRLSASEFMRLYDLSRGRMLALLRTIEDEGWIERLPGNGWQFRPTLSARRAYADAYLFRATVEREALLLPGFRPDPAAFAAARAQQTALLDSHMRESRALIFGQNTAFHEMLMRCAGNDFFLEAVQRTNRLRRLIEYRITTDRSRLPGQSREHLVILDLIEAGRRAEAAEFLFRHIRNAGLAKAAAFG